MKPLLKSLFAIGLTAILTACGGGSSGGGGSQTQVGQFVDDPVQGLSYRCVDSAHPLAATSGKTNAQGQFNYIAGQTCTFKVGNVTVGSLSNIPSDGVVTPQDAAGVSRAVYTAPTVSVIAQFLQSLNDGTSNGKIVIPDATDAALANVPPVSLVTSAGPIAPANLSVLVTTAGKTLVPASQASTNLNAQLDATGVSKTAGRVGVSTPATLNSLSVSASATSNAAGLSEQLTAMANLSDGSSSVANSTVTWSSDNTAVLTIDSTGLATGLKAGTATVTATKGDFTSALTLTVTDAALTSMTIGSAPISLPLGATQTLVATGTYSDGSSKSIANGVTWSTSNGHSTVSSTGIVTATSLGTSVVTATTGGISSTVTIQSTSAVLRSIAVTGSDATTSLSVAKGLGQQLKATGTFSDGSTQDLSQSVRWTASGTSVAVSSSGMLSTTSVGTSTVTATDAATSIAGTLNATVSPAMLSSLAIATPSPIAAGLNSTLTLTGTYSDGTTSTSLSNVNWTSLSPATATVASNGLVAGVAKGSTTLTATVGALSATTTLSVTDPVVQTLTISSMLSTIANGASTVLTAIANFSDSTVQTVTSAVQWIVTTATGNGTATGSTFTGTSPGTVSLKAIYNDITSNILNFTVTPSVSGVAANGAAMGNATVTLTDATGKTLSTTAGDDGTFNFPDLTGYTVPLQLSASGQVGAKQVTQYSIYANALTNGTNTINITPLTSAIVGLVAPSGVLSDLTPAQLAAISPSQVSAASTQIMSVIAPVAANITGAGQFNPITTTFSANGTGVDRLLDHLDVAVRPDGVDISNKMAITTGSSSTATSTVAKGGSATVSPLTATDVVDMSNIDTLIAQFQSCFAVSSTQRLTNKTASSATLASACGVMALPNYLHNGNTFMSRWAGLLNSPAIDNTTKISRPEIRLRISSNPDVIAINLNLVDNTGTGITMPEIIQRQSDGSWKLYGSQRPINAYVETSLIYYQDMTPNTLFNNVNYSHSETGFRFYFDPRVKFSAGVTTNMAIDLLQPGGTSLSTWQSIRDSGGYSMVKCVVVTGPGAFVNGGPKWMGVYPYGLMLKRPSASPKQDYLAIDSRLSQTQNTSITSANIGDSLPNLCPDNGVTDAGGKTTASSNVYTVDLLPLKDQVNPLTGAVDPTMDGRDRSWYTGPRVARQSPDAAMTAILKSNPLFTYYVIDTANVLQLKMNTRYLGDLPPMSQLTNMVEANKLPTWSKDSLARYLNFATGQPSTTSVTANWTNPANGFSADLAGFYSEVYQSMSGTGLRGASSSILRNRSGVGTDNIWTSDQDLATYLDGLAGNNFFWNYATITQGTDPTTGNCNGTYLSSSLNTGFYRGVNSLNNQSLGGTWYGTNDQTNACKKIYNPPSATPNSYVSREMYLRTYTDKNARVYRYVANKNVQ